MPINKNKIIRFLAVTRNWPPPGLQTVHLQEQNVKLERNLTMTTGFTTFLMNYNQHYKHMYHNNDYNVTTTITMWYIPLQKQSQHVHLELKYNTCTYIIQEYNILNNDNTYPLLSACTSSWMTTIVIQICQIFTSQEAACPAWSQAASSCIRQVQFSVTAHKISGRAQYKRGTNPSFPYILR